MKALAWHGANDVRIDNVDDPKIQHPKDAIVEITASAICGSDVHIYHGLIAAMEKGDILGHEFAGRVVEVGPEVSRVKVGDRVVIPFVIACGSCEPCKNDEFSFCATSNPNNQDLKKVTGHPSAGLFGYSHLYGGYSGGQAQYARVPFIDTGALVLPDGISEEHALFLSDIFPTGYMAAENCNIQPGQTVAIWGCGPVGQFAIRSASMLGAERVVAIDSTPERLALAAESGALTLNYDISDIKQELDTLTSGKGPDAVIDAVGMESHGHTIDAKVDTVLQSVKLQTDRSHALREAIMACKPGGGVSIPGVYIGILDNFPLGIAFAKGLTFKMGQTHVQRYLQPLLKKIEEGQIDPRFLITHRVSLNDVPDAYKTFADKKDHCIKVVLNPAA